MKGMEAIFSYEGKQHFDDVYRKEPDTRKHADVDGMRKLRRCFKKVVQLYFPLTPKRRRHGPIMVTLIIEHLTARQISIKYL